jgi:hypothetical protein
MSAAALDKGGSSFGASNEQCDASSVGWNEFVSSVPVCRHATTQDVRQLWGTTLHLSITIHQDQADVAGRRRHLPEVRL